MPRDASSESGRFDAALRQVVLRLRIRHAAYGLAVGALTTLAGRLVAWLAGASGPAAILTGAVPGAGAIAIFLFASRHRRTRAAAAAALERATPGAQNLLVTAEELERHPDRASSWVKARVLQEAGNTAAASSVPRAASLREAAVVATLAIAVLAVQAMWRGDRSPADAARAVIDAVAFGRDRAVTTIVATIEPPAYTRLPAQQFPDPRQLSALEGSRIVLMASAAGTRIRFRDRQIAVDTADILAGESGYFAIEPMDGGERTLIALDVIPDRAPAVRIEAPGKDLLLPDGRRSIPVTVSASDDLGLESLDLRYTKVSGSGEQFEFVEGTLPVRVSRSSPRQWKGEATLDLSPLALEPGDSLVYRATSRDARPGESGLGSSDTFFVEIAGPGQIAFEGFEMPAELERYAMSQQMIVVKIERLRAREADLSHTAVREEAAGIAAEQRTVRANFVFLLGGHVEDEEEEAEQSHEIQEGRLESTARKDINTAIGHMTRTEEGLTAVDTAAALPPARAAVEALQRAFGRSRYLLRSLAVRSRLDPSRRLTGNTSDAGSWRRAVAPDHRSGEEPTALDVYSSLIALASRAASGETPAPSEVAAAAERALAVDPAAQVWREVSEALLEVGRGPREAPAVRSSLGTIVAVVALEARRAAVSRTAAPLSSTPLERAYRSEIRR